MKKLLLITFLFLAGCNTSAHIPSTSVTTPDTMIVPTLPITHTPTGEKGINLSLTPSKSSTTMATKTSIPTQIVSILTATPTRINTSLPTTPTQTITQMPTANATVVLWPLSDAILTSNDFYQSYTPELGQVQLYNDPHPVEKDVTDEAREFCSEDCAKRVWVGQGKILLTIMLVRTSSESSAKKAVENLSQEFALLGDESDLCDSESFRKRNTLYGFAEQTFLATFADPPNNQATTVLITSYGSIYLLIVNQYRVAFDLDSLAHCAAVQYVGKLQIDKLIEAGYIR